MKRITKLCAMAAMALAAVLNVGNFASADTLTIGDFATLNDLYDIEIGADSDIGLFRLFNGNGADLPASFDGNLEFVGTDLLGNFLGVTETFTDLGSSGFELAISATSTGNLVPAAVPTAGGLETITAARIVIGSGFIGGNALDVLPHVATSAIVEVFDQNGSLIVSESVLGLPAFNDAANSFSAFEGFINTNIEGGALGNFGASGDEDRVAEVRLTIGGTIAKAVPEPGSAAAICCLGLVSLVTRRRR